MKDLKVKGIIVKTVNVGEAGKMLTILTAQGKVRALAAGVRHAKSKRLSATQPMCYGEYVLKKNKDFYHVSACECLESFYHIRESVEKLALAAYFLELTEKTAEGHHLDEAVAWLLNTLYMLANKEHDLLLLKSVYELRLMQLLGLAPNLVACNACGDSEDDTCFHFHSTSGGLVCEACECDVAGAMLLDETTLYTLRYILYSPPQKLFGFVVNDDIVHKLTKICKDFLATHLDYPLKTEAYFWNILP
ncbi:MAG: DNA repair protein RecO [Hyphomonadaceae bacterium]|nr:DNA repair protein RecO [Clostridia bacterium]